MIVFTANLNTIFYLSLNVLWLESRGKIPVSHFFLYLIIILNILCFQQRILLLLLLLLLLLPSPPSLACCRKLSSMVAAWSTLIFSVFWLRVSDRKQTNKQTNTSAAARHELLDQSGSDLRYCFGKSLFF